VSEATLTHCPTCGARLARQDLSLCSYCASPLSLGGGAVETDQATRERLERMREHADFAEAMAWVPADPPPVARARRDLLRAGVLALASLAAGAAAGLALEPGAAATALRVAAGLALVAAAVLAARGARLASRWRGVPLVRREAIVTDRRSVTSPRGHTVYFFGLSFADGSGGEFGFQGRGSHHDLLTQGNTGVAFLRGTLILDFKRIRV
jgi:hypothetical protein